MENWLAPIRAWYNGDISPFDYREFAEQGIDAVLEIGVLNYELVGGDHLLVQVMRQGPGPGAGLGHP